MRHRPVTAPRRVPDLENLPPASELLTRKGVRGQVQQSGHLGVAQDRPAAPRGRLLSFTESQKARSRASAAISAGV